jgi:Holliday junction resolvasome RuvABC endonuclease subunit
MAPKPSKLALALKPHVNLILNGTVISVDPSSGSRDSLPGYAIFRAGQYIDSGVITMPVFSDLHKRLFYLGKCLREQIAAVEKPDILVTENIPPVMTGKGFFNRSMVSLQRAIGVVQSSFDMPCLEVAPITWRQNIPDDYRKTDEADAIMMAITVIKHATLLIGKEPPIYSERMMHKLSTGEWQ